jgi:hypothetical protein
MIDEKITVVATQATKKEDERKSLGPIKEASISGVSGPLYSSDQGP